jgi:hypothetical protein
MCQRSAKKTKLHPYHVLVVEELLPVDKEIHVHFCVWFQQLMLNSLEFWISHGLQIKHGYMSIQNTFGHWKIHTQSTYHENWLGVLLPTPKFFPVTTYVNQMTDDLTTGYFSKIGQDVTSQMQV